LPWETRRDDIARGEDKQPYTWSASWAPGTKQIDERRGRDIPKAISIEREYEAAMPGRPPRRKKGRIAPLNRHKGGLSSINKNRQSLRLFKSNEPTRFDDDRWWLMLCDGDELEREEGRRFSFHLTSPKKVDQAAGRTGNVSNNKASRALWYYPPQLTAAMNDEHLNNATG
jgi:hypothetical protein